MASRNVSSAMAVAYFTYLILAGTSMTQGVKHAQQVHINSNAKLYSSNLSRLMANDTQQNADYGK